MRLRSTQVEQGALQNIVTIIEVLTQQTITYKTKCFRMIKFFFQIKDLVLLIYFTFNLL